MPYTSPATWAAGQLVLASDLNANLRDNMLFLGGTTGVLAVGSATGSASNPTTASASLVDMTDMTVTVTTAVNSDLLIWFWVVISSSSTAALTLGVSYDGSDQSSATPNITAAANNVMYHYSVRIANTAAGSHTIKGRWATSVPTATAVGAQRSLIVFEVRHST